MSSLAEALPAEMTRVRDELIPIYLSIGPVGMFGVTMMRQALDEAQRAFARARVGRVEETMKPNSRNHRTRADRR